MSRYTSLSPSELSRMLEKGEKVHIIDVRTPAEYQELRLNVAKNIPLDILRIDSLPQDDIPIAFICKSGTRGRMACEKIDGLARQVFNIEGGTVACEDAGLPVIRGRKVISLERQVRIAAGSIVLTGIALSYVSPYWVGLSAFVGAGLVFAGITDTCGMGMILSKMPWNQKGADNSALECSVR